MKPPLNPHATHSTGIRPHPRGLVRDLLGTTAQHDAPPINPDDDRPLIDHLHEATFHDYTSMQFVKDKYMLRGLLRKAHCFTINTETSRLIADFSYAIVRDLEGARRLAIPPFPVTWFDIDNRARLDRCKELGIKLTATAQREDVIPRVGWLIHPATDLAGSDGFYATYCARFDQGCFVSPLSFFWHTEAAYSGEGMPPDEQHPGFHTIASMCFGVEPSGVQTIDAFPCCSPFQLHYADGEPKSYPRSVYGIMDEIAGELRHVWGLLIALGAGQLGATTEHTPQPRPSAKPYEAKGKTLFAIEHKVLTIKLGRHATPERIARRAIAAGRKKWHDVRGHWRALKNPDGTVRKRVPVKAHSRGDKSVGIVEKTYKVEK